MADKVKKAKEILSGRDVAMVLGYFVGSFPGVPWWRVLEQSGGQMVEQTTHIFDLARYMAGEITEVYAASGVRALQDVPDFDIWDVGTATIRFASGAVGAISNSCVLTEAYEIGLHVICKDLVLVLHLDGSIKIVETGRTEIINGQRSPWAGETEAFINAIKTGDRSAIRSTYPDAVKTLAATLAANESAATGRPVTLALDD
jgi:predicted dehydrogenase